MTHNGPPAARRARFPALCAAALLVPLGAVSARGHTAHTAQPPASDQAAPSFRTGVELVSLNVTVTEGTRYVSDLEATDFQVFEDGVSQTITYFSKANLPIALALLIDTSASMEARLPTAQEAAIGFARRLRPQDLAEVVDFDSRVVVLRPFSNDIAELEQAIRKTSSGGSTSLYNAVYIALKNLRRIVATNTDEIRRQAVVLLSDGEDTSSLLSFEEVLDLARRSETAVYAIGLREEEGSERSGPAFSEADFVLRQLAQETGGRAYFAASVTELAGIYGQISDELSSQYTVGYTSRNTRRDGAFRRVVVRVSRPKVVARAKLGYFAPAAP